MQFAIIFFQCTNNVTSSASFYFEFSFQASKSIRQWTIENSAANPKLWMKTISRKLLFRLILNNFVRGFLGKGFGIIIIKFCFVMNFSCGWHSLQSNIEWWIPLFSFTWIYYYFIPVEMCVIAFHPCFMCVPIVISFQRRTKRRRYLFVSWRKKNAVICYFCIRNIFIS